MKTRIVRGDTHAVLQDHGDIEGGSSPDFFNANQNFYLFKLKKQPTTPVYKPLDSIKRDIRLLHIVQHLDKSATIHCSLQKVSLDDNPQYKSILYEWNPLDNAPSNIEVLVNGYGVFDKNGAAS